MNEIISYRQSVFLISLILPVTGHMLLLVPIFDEAGRDAWISILLTVPIGLLYGVLLYRLHSLHPTKTFVQMLEHAFGRMGGKVLTLGWVAYLFFMVITSFYALVDFIRIFFLPEAPDWVLGFTFYLVVLYALYLGIEPITRFCEPLLLLIFISGTSIGITTFRMKEYELLFPIFEHGFSPVLQGMVLTIALFGELSILLMVGMKKDYAKSKSFLFTNTVSVVLITLMFLGTTTSSLAIFGETLASSLTYPAQSIVRLASFGFIERFDIYGVAVMVVGSVVRMATYQWGLRKSINQWLGIRNERWIVHAIIVLIVIIVALRIIHTHLNFMIVFSNFYSWTAVITVGLPLLTWIIIELKHRIKKALP